MQSLEWALVHLDLSRFSGKRVALNLYALTPDDQGFASEFATSRLEAKGVVVVPDATKADPRLKIFARVSRSRRSSGLRDPSSSMVPRGALASAIARSRPECPKESRSCLRRGPGPRDPSHARQGAGDGRGLGCPLLRPPAISSHGICGSCAIDSRRTLSGLRP